MTKRSTRGRPDNLTKTIPATRVSEETYRFLAQKAERERRHFFTEVVRIALEDYVAQQRQQAA